MNLFDDLTQKYVFHEIWLMIISTLQNYVFIIQMNVTITTILKTSVTKSGSVNVVKQEKKITSRATTWQPLN